MSKSKLTVAQIEAELKKLDERLGVDTAFHEHTGLFAYVVFGTDRLYYFWKEDIRHKAEAVRNVDSLLKDLSDKILAVMDRWDGVL